MDKAWSIQKRILAFRVFDDTHTADNIYKNMKIIFEEYKIESKIFSIGFDNASNNTAVIPALIELYKPYFNSKFFHQRCVCHVLNLCVQKGLEILQAFIKLIKEALSYLWKHPNVMKAWLYDEYRRIYGPSLNISVPQNENVSQTRSFGVLGEGSALLSQKIKRLPGSSSFSLSSISYDEIKTYHSTNFEFIGDDDVDKFDILHWWREHEKHFPILYIIAKQILATPVSTVAVEQEFSGDGNILDARRSLLSPESIQVQVCVDDWTKAGYRQQEMEPEVIYDFFDDDHTTGTGTDGSD
ncbi:hypothetical protein Ddye_029136 [Dipteronia dyeriana]|uniref:HAT C-terminal dimerisation domain-containing protein n=1 Tax=Dipteronia dyeriana TaxID=168575 RepID=A0AAD9TDV7_9ROSI|nr:hypothetical protein Ddye_029136 [Dipteronia dyeriana]